MIESTLVEMKKPIILSWLIFSLLTASSQEYKVSTDKTDAFSIALVRLLNCAVTDFNSCKGQHLQYTMMQENEYRLMIDFPGATAAIVRERDSWDKNAYVEFRGYKNLTELKNGMIFLMNKVKHALGDQLNPDHTLHSGPDNAWFLTGMGIRDQNGYFSSNIELMSGSSSSPSYLLEKTGIKPDDSASRQYFILLKVQRGIPSYFNYIRNSIPAPDKLLDEIVKELVIEAGTDFMKFNKKNENITTSRHADTILLKEQKIYLRYGGQNYQATLMFPSSPEKNKFEKLWNYYQQVVQSALGEDYVYYSSSYDAHLNGEVGKGRTSIVYFRKDHKPDQPRVYLEAGEDSDGLPVIFIKIESSVSHPVKRHATYQGI